MICPICVKITLNTVAKKIINIKWLCFSAIIVFIVACGPPLEKKILGEWKGELSSGQEVILIFKKKNEFLGIWGNDSIEGNYHIDCSGNPAKLDIEIAEEKRALTIIEFIDDDKMKFQKAEFERPKAFTDAVILYKKISQP